MLACHSAAHSLATTRGAPTGSRHSPPTSAPAPADNRFAAPSRPPQTAARRPHTRSHANKPTAERFFFPLLSGASSGPPKPRGKYPRCFWGACAVTRPDSKGKKNACVQRCGCVGYLASVRACGNRPALLRPAANVSAANPLAPPGPVLVVPWVVLRILPVGTPLTAQRNTPPRPTPPHTTPLRRAGSSRPPTQQPCPAQGSTPLCTLPRLRPAAGPPNRPHGGPAAGLRLAASAINQPTPVYIRTPCTAPRHAPTLTPVTPSGIRRRPLTSVFQRTEAVPLTPETVAAI